MTNLVEIIPDLWLSNSQSSQNLNFFNKKFIIINCSKDLNFLGKHKTYNKSISQNLEQYEILKMYNYLVKTTEFINKNLLNFKPVLIYCSDGKQKAPSIIAAYLMRYGKITYNKSINILKTKKNDIFLNGVEYQYALQKFYQQLF